MLLEQSARCVSRRDQNLQDCATPYAENMRGRNCASNGMNQKDGENPYVEVMLQALNLSPDALIELSEILRLLPGTVSGSLVQHMTHR